MLPGRMTRRVVASGFRCISCLQIPNRLSVNGIVPHWFGGIDRQGNFEMTPIPERDFDPKALAFQQKAAKAMSEVLYAGAERNTSKL